MAATDSNGMTWQHLLAKHGPWALGCGVMGFVIYSFVLMPSQHEREAFIKTSIQNAESMEVVAENTESIKESTVRQEKTLENINDELEGQTHLREQAMDTMTAFADEMRMVNPNNGLKLDVIIKQMEEDENSQKLDIIIEKMEIIEEQGGEQE